MWAMLARGCECVSGTWRVVLIDGGESSERMVEALRSAADLDLEEAQDVLQSLPCEVATGLNASEAGMVSRELQASGATTRIDSTTGPLAAVEPAADDHEDDAGDAGYELFVGFALGVMFGLFLSPITWLVNRFAGYGNADWMYFAVPAIVGVTVALVTSVPERRSYRRFAGVGWAVFGIALVGIYVAGHFYPGPPS